MSRALSVAALVLVAGCDRQEPAAPPANDATIENAATPAPAEASSLVGNWRVVRIAGVPDAAGIGMSAAITGDMVTLSAGCLRRAWTYTQNRNVVAFTASPSGSSNCGGQSPGAGAETAYAALTEANIAIFSRDGKEASLSGTGGTLTLERR